MVRGTGKLNRGTGEMMSGTGEMMHGTGEMMRSTHFLTCKAVHRRCGPNCCSL